MAKYFSDIQTQLNGPAFGQPLTTRTKTNRMAGRIRFFEAFYVVPSGGLSVGDQIF